MTDAQIIFADILKTKAAKYERSLIISYLIHGFAKQFEIYFIPNDINMVISDYYGEYLQRFNIKKWKRDTKIWIISWNMSNINYDISKDNLSAIFPKGYDLYVVGIQEAISNTIFDVIGNYLEIYNVVRMPFYDQNKIFGVHAKNQFTTLAIYYNINYRTHIYGQLKLSISSGIGRGSKGAACALLKIYSSTIAFCSIHTSNINKLQSLLKKCKKKLLNADHVICFGTMNSKIKDLTLNEILKQTQNGTPNIIWNHDTLYIKLKNNVLKDYKEAIPERDFYPTYFDNDGIPSFCDRILFHSKPTQKSEQLIARRADRLSLKTGYYHKYGNISRYLKGSAHAAIYGGFWLQSDKLYEVKSNNKYKWKNNGSVVNINKKVYWSGYSHQIVLMCGGGVGKSTLINQFISGTFEDYYDPTIEQMYSKTATIDGVPCQLEIMDTAGQDQYDGRHQIWIEEAEIFLVVYSITQKSTFDETIIMTEDKIFKYKDKEDCVIILVGNKCDMENDREVTTEEGKTLAKQWGDNCYFLETSAKQNINVEKCFYEGIRIFRRINTIKHWQC